MSARPKNPFLLNRISTSHHQTLSKPRQIHVLVLTFDQHHYRLILPGEKSTYSTLYYARRVQCVLVEYQKKLLYRLRPRPQLTLYFNLHNQQIEVVTPQQTFQVERDKQGNIDLAEQPPKSN